MMGTESPLLIAVLVVAGCGAEPRDGETTGVAALASSPASSSAEPPAVHDGVAGEPVCLPVAACNMFVSCALARPERDAAGATSYRVLAYDHHPSKVGSIWQRESVCWDQQAGGAAGGCAEALLYRDVPCTPMPNAQLALAHRCRLDDGRCVAVPDAPQPAPSASDAPITNREITDVVKALRADARAKCWDPLSKATGPSSVEIVVRFTIEPSGKTSHVGASGPREPPSLARCVGKLVEAARFPANQSPTAISVPFTFAR